MRKLKYYFQLLKFRLSITVVFSAVAGYFLGTDLFLTEELLYLIFGGLLVTGSANGFNQILERDYDKIMTRTAKRPLPLKNLKLSEAVLLMMNHLKIIYSMPLLNQKIEHCPWEINHKKRLAQRV